MNLFEIVRAEAASYPVTVLCRLLNVSKSGYYAYVGRASSGRDPNDLRLTTKIRAIHARTRGVYGSRRMVHELDEHVGRKRVARLMREHGLLAHSPRRFRVTTDSKHALPVARNLLQQTSASMKQTKHGSLTSPTSGPRWVGATSPSCSIFSAAESLAGRSPITCELNCRSKRWSGP
jgi:putative transposase